MPSYGRIINGIYYIALSDNNNLKKISLEDNIYFTNRDIFCNAGDIDTIMEANSFSRGLTGGISYENRTETFKYTDVLNDITYLQDLIDYYGYINIGYFDFLEPFENEEINIEDYISFDDWFTQFKNLIDLLKTRLKILKLN